MFRFPGHFPHYFRKHLPLQLEELYLSSAIMDFAASAIALFEPIYLWTLGYSLKEIMFFYFIVYAAYFLLLPLGGKFVARFGHERSVLISTLWLVGYLMALIGIKDVPGLFYIAPFLLTLQKTFYWPAYHFDFMRFSLKEERSSEYSGLWAITTLMYTLGPVVGGVVIKLYGFPTMFLGSMILILLSSVPLFVRRPAPKVESYSYWQSMVLPFRRRYWRNTIGYLGLGSELVQMVVWPIFIALVFKDLFNVGALVGLSALVTAVITLMVGKWGDRTPKHHILNIGGVSNAGVWLLRTISHFPPWVFFLDILGRFSNNTAYVTMTAMTYDRAHDDDMSWHGVYYEQGFAIAKSLMALMVIALTSIAEPFTASFVAAAVISFFFLVF